MKSAFGSATRVFGVLALIAILKMAFSSGADASGGAFDLRAFLLVFVTPWVLLMISRKSGPSLPELLGRLRGLSGAPASRVQGELHGLASDLTGNYRASSLARLSEGHSDPFVRYAAGLLLAKYPTSELNRLLVRKVEAEDQRWQELCNLFGFLAKMSPYFGMTATVIGMVRLLENMSDFTRISGGIALAMQGTLYGLLAFTLIYAPIQRLLQETRDQALQRNELVARFFLGIAQESDASFLRDELNSQLALSTDLPSPPLSAARVDSRLAPGANA